MRDISNSIYVITNWIRDITKSWELVKVVRISDISNSICNITYSISDITNSFRDISKLFRYISKLFQISLILELMLKRPPMRAQRKSAINSKMKLRKFWQEYRDGTRFISRLLSACARCYARNPSSWLSWTICERLHDYITVRVFTYYLFSITLLWSVLCLLCRNTFII